MVCTLEELRCKDVINIVNGENLGRVDDLQMDANSATVTALILYGRPRFFGILANPIGWKRCHFGGVRESQQLYNLYKCRLKSTKIFYIEILDQLARFLV